MTTLTAERLASLATEPYRRGAELQEILLGAEAGDWTEVQPYDFREYHARHGHDPEAPRYVVVTTQPNGRDPVTLEAEALVDGLNTTAEITIPAFAPAGRSFALPLPEEIGPTDRLFRIRQHPVRAFGPGAGAFRTIALLGNFSKLLWLISAEQDDLNNLISDVAGQRSIDSTRGSSLDLIGADLRVTRFPARAYSVDTRTAALYHLDTEGLADGDVIADETTRFGVAGHPGINRRAASVHTGKFGPGVSLPGSLGDGHIEIPHHPDFNGRVGSSLTVETFVMVERDSLTGPAAVIIKGPLAGSGALTGSGWALTVGPHRGFSANPRWNVQSGTRSVELFADTDIADGSFHHLAGVLDREARLARLFVDGVERATSSISGLGAAGNGQMVRIGRSATGHQLAGVLDEVRISDTERLTFHPVLGEGDEAYRQRLAIFREWRLPSPDVLETAINQTVSIAGDPESFVVDEVDRETNMDCRLVRIVPTLIPSGRSIDRDGSPWTNIDDVCGPASDEASFQEAFLFRHDHPQVVYESDENSRKMHAGAAWALDELISIVDDVAPGHLLHIERSYDPEDPGLHRVGRALEIWHQSLPLGELAAFAHRAGFDYVEHQRRTVKAAVERGPELEIIATVPAIEQPPVGDVYSGRSIDLEVRPSGLPAAGRFEWTIVPCGQGGGGLLAHPADPLDLTTPIRSRRRVRVLTDHPGELSIAVEYRLNGVTASGSRTLRVSVDELSDGQQIASDGDMSIDAEAAVGSPEDDFDSRYLVRHSSGVTFLDGPGTARMQIQLDRTLEGLVELLGRPPAELKVVRGFAPGAPGLRGVGRAVELRHDTVAASTVAALAHEAGFGHVARNRSRVVCSVKAGARIEIVLAADGSPLPDEMRVGETIDLAVRPDGIDADGELNWAIDDIGEGRGSLYPVLRPKSSLTARKAGLIAATVLFVENDPLRTPPYAFEVRLNNDLEAAGKLIPKDQYDVIMNTLNYYHPMGVEVLTRKIREKVVEVRDGLLDAFPGYTYPDFRV